ncbi:MerR family transcriptional regulator [Thiomicrorhabdus xiamenensis]|uniref:MerR family transcriptional regulator n=1 Tax=Thiomicrorhabdus xiamenensis TaxID=2739063 RepID=A0A7D4NXV9_9GAMM|nr:MerR family transcriptional regulator [Thiomicrorhabdus xiamenensis]
MVTTKNKVIDVDSIPAKKYLTIGEVSRCTGIKDHVLRYWEQHFDQLTPSKRSGRRYYQREDVLLIIEINRLLNEEGLTIPGAQNRLAKKSKSKSESSSDSLQQTLQLDKVEEPVDIPVQELQQALQIADVICHQLDAFQKHLKDNY